MTSARAAIGAGALALFLAGPAQAACFAEYKAKQEDPLRLHYGILQLDDAACTDPAPAVSRRIAVDGWQLLAVTGILDRSEAEARRADAGAYYLRY